MNPNSSATLSRIDLINGMPSAAIRIAEGGLREMIRRALGEADTELWRFVIHVRGSRTLLPGELGKLEARWSA